MSAFQKAEKDNQVAFRKRNRELKPDCHIKGVYSKNAHAFCLPKEQATKNLYAGFRKDAIKLFKELGIPWHKGVNGGPTSHLCSSQVCCVNFLFPFVHNPHALVALMQPWFPRIARALPMDESRPDEYLTFEWIGQANYLREREGKNGRRTRGANTTSADAAARFEMKDGGILVVLIEWKYTESYTSTPYHTSSSGTSREEVYKHLQGSERFVLRQKENFKAVFYEPFYQLFREQSLAAEMKHARELGATDVNVIHVSPGANARLGTVTSPALVSAGPDVLAVWKGLLKHPEDFIAVKTEDLFQRAQFKKWPALDGWRKYLSSRYTWLQVP